ncbi:MAG: hypothetical protein IKI12_11420 [Lachnospiraceae bacterium]|nr:hypothetical protein [Lachnospiraceae bacterium]
MKKKSLPERIFLHLKEGWLAALIVFAAALGANFERPMRLDDLYFDRMFTSFDGNILSFAQEYWMIWSGRVVPHTIFVFLMGISPVLVNILSAAVTAGLIVLMAKIAQPEKDAHGRRFLLAVLILLMFYLATPVELLNVTVFWKTAGVLYVWGLFFALLALWPLIKLLYNEEGVSNGLFAAALFGAVYGAGFESSGAVFAAFGGAALLAALISRRKVTLRHVVIYAVGTGAFIFFMNAPGNAVRFEEECLYWYPDFDMLSLADKFFMGIFYTLGDLIGSLRLPMVLISLFLFLYTILGRKGLGVTVLSLLPLLYYSLPDVRELAGYYRYIYPPVMTVEEELLVNTGVALFVVFLLFFLILSVTYAERSIVPAFFFAGALLAAAVMAFSPTFFVSEDRGIFFAREVLMLPVFTLFSLDISALWDYYRRRVRRDPERSHK